MLTIAPPSRDQPGQQPVRDRDQRGDVGVDHHLPLFEAAELRGRGAEREPGVVHQQVDLGEGGWQRVNRLRHRGGIAHVEHQRQHRRAKFRRQRVEPIGAAPGRDDLPPGPHQGAQRRITVTVHSIELKISHRRYNLKTKKPTV